MCQASSIVPWHGVRCSKYDSFYCYRYDLTVLALDKKRPDEKVESSKEEDIHTLTTLLSFYGTCELSTNLPGKQESLVEG